MKILSKISVVVVPVAAILVIVGFVAKGVETVVTKIKMHRASK